MKQPGCLTRARRAGIGRQHNTTQDKPNKHTSQPRKPSPPRLSCLPQTSHTHLHTPRNVHTIAQQNGKTRRRYPPSPATSPASAEVASKLNSPREPSNLVVSTRLCHHQLRQKLEHPSITSNTSHPNLPASIPPQQSVSHS